MKTTLQSLLAVLFAATLLGACSKKEEVAPPPAAEMPAAMPAPVAEPAHQEPGGWVPPPADAAPMPAPAAEAAPMPAPDAAPVKAE